ncbi:MAG: WYL domain-containing protein [Clostridia bacterium]|nr:WYL domain-containing protein [Clostridia bacterium]
MPRSENQKLKMLYLKQFFEEKTDENHPATMADILAYLKAHGVEAERKSVYSDITALEDYGMALRDEEKERNKGYRLFEHEFELKEVKLICDSIASSKFLSESMSDKLIKKLGTLVSEHQRKEVRRQVRVMGRAKTMNNSALNAVDHIHAAIEANTTIKFKYFHYDIKLERQFSRKGEMLEVSPWALLYDNDNYYLLAYIDGDFRTYRVDRMASVSPGTNERQGKEEFEKMDMPAYTKSTFGMYNGKQEQVTMVFHNRMLDTVIDQFGKEVWLSKVDDWHFKVTVTVAVSPQFFAWVFGLGNYVTITAPDNVVKQMKDMLAKVSKRYEQP